jgi:hypothetical protein
VDESYWDAVEIAAYIAEDVHAILQYDTMRNRGEMLDTYRDSAHRRYIIAQVAFAIAARVDWYSGHEVPVFGPRAAALICDHFHTDGQWDDNDAVVIAEASLVL